MKTITKKEWESLIASISFTHVIVQKPVGDDLHVTTAECVNGKCTESSTQEFIVKDCKPI